jgi:hypothetical protein
VRALAWAWIYAARARRRWRPFRAPRAELIRRFAPGLTFADIGCMWNVDGEMCFVAEESGASAVTGVDIMAPTDRFMASLAQRGSSVRFVRGDIHEPGLIEPHDVVWCSGVLYHAPNPLLTLERLRAITGSTLIVATETIPDVPGLAQACVFLPGLGASDRRLHAAARPGALALGVTTPFDPAQSYGAWWWGISRSALHGMLAASGLEVVEEYGDALHATLVARHATAGTL